MSFYAPGGSQEDKKAWWVWYGRKHLYGSGDLGRVWENEVSEQEFHNTGGKPTRKVLPGGRGGGGWFG